MSKAKDNYYELKDYLDRYMGGPVNDVSNYVTELEKKIVEYEKMLLEQCWNETVEKYGDVLTKLAKE